MAICISWVLCSCGASYAPNAVNSPLLSKKGDAQVAVHTGTSGINPQAAYAITNHLGIMTNGSFKKYNNSDKNYTNYGELGLGYYTTFSEKGRIEAYAGYGIGNYKYINSFHHSVTIHSGSFSKFFIQPSIGYVSKIFEGSFATRFAYINVDDISGKDSSMLINPVITAKVGYKFIKVVFQSGLSFGLDDINDYINNQPFMFTVGLQLNINQLFNNN